MSKGVLGKISCKTAQGIFDSFYDMADNQTEINGIKVDPQIALIEGDYEAGPWRFPSGLHRIPKTTDEQGKATSYYDRADIEPIAAIKLPGVLSEENGYYVDWALVCKFPDGSFRVIYDISDTYDKVGATKEDAEKVQGMIDGVVNSLILKQNEQSSSLNVQGNVTTDDEDVIVKEGEMDLDDIVSAYPTMSADQQEALKPLLERQGYRNL